MSNQSTPNAQQQMQQQQIQQQIQQQQQQMQQQESFEHQMIEDPRVFISQMQETREHQKHRMHHNFHEPSCITVAEHTTNCIVCSKLYQNNSTGYIIVIILLAIISILLLKRVLNV
jgi:hypothetical protein